MIPLDAILQVLTSHLKRFYKKILECGVLSELVHRSFVLAHRIVGNPDFVFDSWRIHAVILIHEQGVPFEVEIRQVLTIGQLIEHVRIFGSLAARVAIDHLFHVLLSFGVMLVGRPVRVKLVADLSVFLLLICFLDEWMLQEFGPGETLTGSLVQKAL